MICPNCNTEINDLSKFCTKCGVNIKKQKFKKCFSRVGKKHLIVIGIIACIITVLSVIFFVNGEDKFTKYKNSLLLTSSATIGIQSDGSIVMTGSGQNKKIQHWTDICAVSKGSDHIVGLKKDGTVIAIGDNSYGQCDVKNWDNIIDIVATGNTTIGLKKDGTVIATGANDEGQCDVEDWEDITYIASSWDCTVGIRENGTVVATGDNSHGQCDVDGWDNIIKAYPGDMYTIGLRKDGTVTITDIENINMSRMNSYLECILNIYEDVQTWNDIIDITVGGGAFPFVVGLKNDGTVAVAGYNEYGNTVNNWTDIVAISAQPACCVGLKSDGTVVAAGYNEYGECNVSDWDDIVAVFAGNFYTVGLKDDGTVVATGDNEYGQCNIEDWDLF